MTAEQVYLVGHGSYDLAEPLVRVPRESSVAYYSDFDMNSTMTIATAVLNAGDITPREIYSAPKYYKMPNYTLTPLTADEMAGYIASVSSRLPGKLLLVGVDAPVEHDPMRMCTMPTLCNGRAAKEGHHPDCRGLLAVFPMGTRIHVLACRSPFDVPGTPTLEVDAYTTLEGVRTSRYGEQPTAYINTITTEGNRVLELAATDPQAALAYVRSLPQSTVASLGTLDGFLPWLEVTHNPLTEASRQDDIDAWAELIVRHRDEGYGLLLWRALPKPTRRVLIARGGRQLVAFVRDNIGQIEETATDLALPTAGSVASAVAESVYRWFTEKKDPPPESLSVAWGDPVWRDAFVRWLTDNPPPDIATDNLLALRDLLSPENPEDTPVEGSYPPGGINPRPHGLPDSLQHLADVHEFLITHIPPTGYLGAPVAAVIEHYNRVIDTEPILDPDSPTTAAYLADYRRLHASEVPDDYPPEGFDPDSPDQARLDADSALTRAHHHWAWAHAPAAYTDLTPEQQIELFAWVYPERAHPAFDELPADLRTELTILATTLLATLAESVDQYLAYLYTEYRRHAAR